MRAIQQPVVLDASHRREDDRGTLIEVMNRGAWRSVLCGSMRRGAVMGHHYHNQAEVFVFLTSGRADVGLCDPHTMQTTRMTVGAEQGILLPTGISHALRFTEDSTFVMLKSLPYDPASGDTVHYPVPDFD
jgi:dTDP-4-dehydrorhamnose 3,5-epimerase-like enzyme